MKQIYLVLLLSVFIYWNKANGQIAPSELEASVKAGIDPYFVESHDTVSKFGPGCITRDLLQDKNGNYWLATWHGIIKYDGKVFTNYTLKEGLIRFHVVSCYEDKKGNLWFGTARGGLYRYNGKSFTLFTTKDGLADNSVSCFAEDKLGNIWFGTEKGASRYDGKTFTNFAMKDGLRSSNVSSIMQDKTGKLWFGCLSSKYMGDDGGVNCYDGKSFTSFTNKDGKPFKSVTSLFEDKDGNVWIGRFDGLTRYDGKSFTEFLPNYLTYYIVDDKEGNIWLTHSEPNTHHSNLPEQILYRYDGKAFTKIIEKYEPGDCQIFGKILDKAGNIWFGTMKGVCRMNISRTDHPCTKNTCKHDLPYQQAVKEHKQELAKSLTYFTE
jgi:ligand-binding sensor domain-containing protein